MSQKEKKSGQNKHQFTANTVGLIFEMHSALHFNKEQLIYLLQ